MLQLQFVPDPYGVPLSGTDPELAIAWSGAAAVVPLTDDGPGPRLSARGTIGNRGFRQRENRYMTNASTALTLPILDLARAD